MYPYICICTCDQLEINWCRSKPTRCPPQTGGQRRVTEDSGKENWPHGQRTLLLRPQHTDPSTHISWTHHKQLFWKFNLDLDPQIWCVWNVTNGSISGIFTEMWAWPCHVTWQQKWKRKCTLRRLMWVLGPETLEFVPAVWENYFFKLTSIKLIYIIARTWIWVENEIHVSVFDVLPSFGFEVLSWWKLQVDKESNLRMSKIVSPYFSLKSTWK